MPASTRSVTGAAGSSGRRRIVLFGMFGTNNIGNDATLQVMLHQVRSCQPYAEVACVCNELPPFATNLGVTPLPLNPLPLKGRWRLPGALLRNLYTAIGMLLTEPFRRRRMRTALLGADALVFVGTGVFDDYGLMPWDMPAWMLGWARSAKAVGAEVQLMAVGAGPIRNAANRALMRRTIALASPRILRDTVSRNYLDSLRLDTTNDRVIPDLVFAMPPCWLPARKMPDVPPRSIGVGVMGYFGWNAAHGAGEAIYSEYIGKLQRFIRWLLDSGYMVRLLVGELPTDERPVRDLLRVFEAERGSLAPDRLIAASITSLDSLLREVAMTDLVVASRFHNVICALALGRPTIAIGYADKFDELMTGAGLGAYCQRIETLDVDRLQADFVKLANSCQGAHLRQRAAGFRVQVEQAFVDAFGSLPGGVTERAAVARP